jgi:Holliday junction resolvase RusA-like endonuclease
MGLAKRQEVKDYQDRAVPVIRSARPSGWAPVGQVRITYAFYLASDVDCDNMMKAIHDSIQVATDVNDRRFLPCVETKEWGLPPKDARVEVTVEDQGSPFVAPPGSPSTPSPSSTSSSPSPPRPRSYLGPAT